MSAKNPATEWRAVPGYEGRYEVSDAGEVRSLLRGEHFIRRGVPAFRMREARLLKQRVDDKGYLRVNLYRGAGGHVVMVNQLVLLAFVGPRPAGQGGRHLDGNSLNNSRSNLVYGTQLENMRDKVRHGTQPVGEAMHNAKITEADVRRIRAARWGEGAAIARSLNITSTMAWRIRARLAWRHVP